MNVLRFAFTINVIFFISFFMINTAEKKYVYDFIPRSVQRSNGNLEYDFRKCLIAVLVYNADPKVTRDRLPELIPQAREKVAHMAPEVFQQKFYDWLLIRHWYITHHGLTQ